MSRRSRTSLSKRIRVPAPALAGLAAILLVTASALGFWKATGTGNASGAASGSLVVSFSPGAPGGRLHPGGSTDVALRIENPNPYSVRVASLVLDSGQGSGGFDVDGSRGGCALSALSFTTQTNSGAGWSVAPRVGSTDGTLDVDLANALAMATGAAAACQGASFTVHLAAGP
jgi:hypothetical protein